MQREGARRPRWWRVRRARRLTGLLLFGMAVVLAGCRTVTTVDVRLDALGAGSVSATVRLDGAAAAALGDARALVRVHDLRRAGWEVPAPRALSDGGIELRATRRVAGPRQAEAALRDLAGTGVLDSLRVRRAGAPLRHEITLRGTADLRSGIDSLADARVTEVAGGELVSLLGEPPAGSVTVRLRTDLAGTVREVDLPLGSATAVRASGGGWSLDLIVPALLTLASLAGLSVLRFHGRL